MTDPISEDLAALGRRARDRLPGVAVTLERLAPRAELPADRALVVLSRAFCDRVARGAAGATAVVLLAIMSAYLGFSHAESVWYANERTWITDLVYGPQFLLWGLSLCGVLVAHGIAERVAVRVFDRATAGGDTLARARVLVERVAGWTLWFAVAGAMAYVLVFGMLRVVLDGKAIVDVIGFPSERDLRVHTAEMLGVLVAVAVVCGALAMRGVVVGRGITVAVGIMLLLLTMLLGMLFDNGVLGAHMRHASYEQRQYYSLPSFDAVRFALTGAGTVAVYLIVGSVFARRHRREVAGL